MSDELIKEYALRCKQEGITYTYAAREIVAQGKSTLSVKTLREKISRYLTEHDSTNVPASSKQYEYKGRKRITSQEEAVKFFKIDLSKERIIRSRYNAWDVTSGNGTTYTNYQVRLDTEPVSSEFDYEAAYKILNKHVSKLSVKRSQGSGKCVASISDIHTGAKTNASKGVINTRDYNLEVLLNYLDKCVNEINNLNKKEVIVTIHGDLVESISGLNHLNSWQEIEENAHGGNVIIITHKILSLFLSRVVNLKKVYMVSGNHDRLSAGKDVDSKGDVGLLVSYMLKQNFDVEYHPLACSFIYDGISYIITHGHHKLVTKPISQTILNYGNQNYYNVLISGHTHSRNTKKESYIMEDSVNYRAIVLAPFFTGNFYSESSGWTSSPGFSVIEANAGKTNINHFDYGL